MRTTASIAFASFFIAAAGCGPGVGTLSGKVTHEGKPLNAGTVQVVHSNGTSYTADIQPDGSYTIPNIPEGAATVGVSNPNPMAKYQELVGFAKTEEQRASVKKPTPEEIRSWIAIPNSYATPDSSGLNVEIKKGANPKDLSLTGSADPIAPVNPGTPTLPPRAKVK